MTSIKVVGILALQGCVNPHIPHFKALNVEVLEVRTAEELKKVDALVLPGGESSAMWKIIDYYQLEELLRDHFLHKPTWGICAGSILLANEVLGIPQKSFHMGPYNVIRNAYGRQVESEEAMIANYPVCFIRAPKLVMGDQAQTVEILATHQGDPVWIQWGHFMVTTFHPELTSLFPSPMHSHFIQNHK